jgi:hypothetical protein
VKRKLSNSKPLDRTSFLIGAYPLGGKAILSHLLGPAKASNISLFTINPSS